MFISIASIEDFFFKIKMPYDCEFLVVRPVNKEQKGGIKLSLMEVYQDHPTKVPQQHPVAHWTTTGGFVWTATPLLQRRANLHGISLRVGVNSEVNDELISFSSNHKLLIMEESLFMKIS